MVATIANSFNPHANSIGFVRWLMAFIVIFAHAGPLADFYGGQALGTQWSDEQNLGGVAVCGFFFLSGFLITKSRMGSASTLRFFWRRAMRIFPAFWASLIVVAFVLAPIAWIRETGSISGYFASSVDSPFTYFYNNMWLTMSQWNIANMGSGLPFYANWGVLDWNGSAWTLGFEFAAYIMVGVLGVIGALSHRIIGAVIAFGIIGLSSVQWLMGGTIVGAGGLFADSRLLLLFAPFALGIVFALFGDKIPFDDRLALGAIVLAVVTYSEGGWLVFGQYFFCYFLIWFAIRATKLQRWERFGDFSYGIYIIAWPLMQFGAYFGLQNYGWFVYHVVIVVSCHVYAYLSWHLLEKPAMELKNWTPRWLSWLYRVAIDPASARIRTALGIVGARVQRATQS